MPCDFRLKKYCFHPERATGDLIAINCVYDWIIKSIDEKRGVDNFEGSKILEGPVNISKKQSLKSEAPAQ